MVFVKMGAEVLTGIFSCTSSSSGPARGVKANVVVVRLDLLKAKYPMALASPRRWF